jgi:predicted phosphodiesterase
MAKFQPQQIAKQYLADYPKAATATIARKAYAENPEVWRSYDSARSCFRRVRGNMGASHRQQADPRHKRPNGKQADTFPALPKPLSEWRKPWGAERFKGPFKALILNDVHVPYYDRGVLQMALEYGIECGCNFVLLNGDFVDCYSVSKWQTDPRKRDFPSERDMAVDVIATIRGMFGDDARIVLKLGNHEERLERYLQVKAPELLSMPEFEWPSLLRAEQSGLEIIGEMRPLMLGKLTVIHGHEYRFSISNPVNPARGLYLRGKVNAVCGHFHQSSNHSEKDLASNVTTCWSIGCMCQMHPEYAPINKWNHGFAVVDVKSNGAFSVENRRIVDGEIWA